MSKFVWLRVKAYSYLTDDSSEDKKQKAKKVCHNRNLNLKIIKTV